MMRNFHTLLLGFTVVITTYGMENDNTHPRIKKKRASNQLTQSTPSLSSSIKKSQQNSEKKHPASLLTQSIPYGYCDMENTSPRIEITPPRIERKRASNSLNRSTPSLASAIEKSPRKPEIKRPSSSLSQSTLYCDFNMENTSPTIEITPPKIERKYTSNSPTRFTPSLEKSPRKPEIKRTSSSLSQSKSVSHDDSDTEEPLLDAVKKNDLNRIQKILNINMPDKEGNTPFIIAAKNGYKKIINELLQQPTLKPNMRNLCKMTALHCAAEKGHKNIVKILVLDPRIDASIMNKDRRTVRELINKSNISFRKKLFGRITLDNFVNEEVSALHKFINNKQMSANLTDQNLMISITIIKRNLIKITEKQAEKLSKDAIIPSYATNEFIGQMVKWRFFNHNKTTTSALDQALSLQQSATNNKQEKKEITSILL